MASFCIAALLIILNINLKNKDFTGVRLTRYLEYFVLVGDPIRGTLVRAISPSSDRRRGAGLISVVSRFTAAL